MKLQHTLLFIISALFVSLSITGQENSVDTLSHKSKYGVRVGVDISKPFRSLVEADYSGFEILGDFRLSEKFYAAAELGNENRDLFESNLSAKTSGSYAKVGFDYNAYNNWFGLNNAIFTGLRYGFSTFKQELLSYNIYTSNQLLAPSVRVVNMEYSGLTAHWAELIVGIKTEVLNNLYISVQVQLKRKLSEDRPDNFDNLYIPGFNTTNDFSEFGAGYGYSISYLIPLFQK